MTLRAFAAGLALLMAGLIGDAVSGVARADVYSITAVPVDARADNAAEARDKALREGRRAAFWALVKRLTREEDRARITLPSDPEIARMEASLKIDNERNSRQRYLARIDYAFRPQAVRAFLQKSGVPFSDSQARPAVIVPVLEAEGRQMLWDPSNPWLAAWTERRLIHELIPIETPLGDLKDISMVDTQRALLARWPDLRGLAERYGGGDVIVAYARLEPAGVSGARQPSQGFTPSTQLRGLSGTSPRAQADTSPEPAETGPQYTLDVTLWRISDSQRQGTEATATGPLNVTEGTAPFIETVSTEVTLPPSDADYYESGSFGDPNRQPEEPRERVQQVPEIRPGSQNVFQKAVTASLQAMSSQWKELTLVDYSELFELSATVRLSSLTDWSQVRGTMDELAIVTRWSTSAISPTGAELDVVFSGTVDQLALNLKQRGFALSGENGYWEVQREALDEPSLQDIYGQRPPVFRVRSYAGGDPLSGDPAEATMPYSARVHTRPMDQSYGTPRPRGLTRGRDRGRSPLEDERREDEDDDVVNYPEPVDLDWDH